MVTRPENERSALDLVAPVLLLVTPFVILLRHAESDLLTPATLLALAWLAGLGALLGAVAACIGWPARVLLVAALVTLFVDFQTTWLGGFGVRAAGVFAGTACLAALVHRRLSALVCVMGATLLVTSIVLPVDRPEAAWQSAALPPARSDLPPIVHIILDEHIGVEGLPADVDPDGSQAEALKRFYLDWGFDVYGGAYSISTNSVVSISNLMNTNVEPSLRRFYAPLPGGGEQRFAVQKSSLLERLAEAGYRIRIRQSDYLDFCRTDPPLPIELCDTYELETIRSIRDAPLHALDKAGVMLALYGRLSSMIVELQGLYRRFVFIQKTRGRSLPAWTTVGRVSATSVMPVFDALRDDLANAQPGTVYFAHLMLPHYPYAYDADCAIRPDPEQWLDANDAAQFPSVNSPEGRRLRYGLYLPQLECTRRRMGELFDAMRAAGTFDGARILVHGDHGSRIQIRPMALAFEDRIETTDYLDAFPTLFALKEPGAVAPGRYDDRLLAVQELADLATGQGDPATRALEGPPVVYLSGRGSEHPVARPMPRFAHGRILDP